MTQYATVRLGEESYAQVNELAQQNDQPVDEQLGEMVRRQLQREAIDE